MNEALAGAVPGPKRRLIKGTTTSSGFADRLTEFGGRVILNPVHDRMRRYEMREKRRYFSRGGRTVVTVWNQGKGREARLPWTAFHDGEERTEAVRELNAVFDDRPNIRIGVLDLEQVFAPVK